MDKNALIPILHAQFFFDAHSGCLRKKQPLTSPDTWPRPGGTDANGYHTFTITAFGEQLRLREHIAIWAMVHGTWPKAVRRRNNDPQDNRLANLYEADAPKRRGKG